MPPTGGEPVERDWDERKWALLDALTFPDEIAELLGPTAPEELRERVRAQVESFVDQREPTLPRPERERLIEELLDELLGFGALENLLKDPTVSDISVFSPHLVVVERRGRLEPTDLRFRSTEDVERIITRIERAAVDRGTDVVRPGPITSLRLPDGSAFRAVRPPVAPDGPYLRLVRFGANPLKLEDLLNYKALVPEMAMLIEAALKARLNVLISGGTGSGKITLLNTLSSLLPDNAVAVSVEQNVELQLQLGHVLRLRADAAADSEQSFGALLRRAVDLQPDVIVAGEVLGAEAWDLLEVMDSGPHQTLATIHAEDAPDALARMEWMAQSAHDLPAMVLRRLMASGLDLIVQLNRLQGGPRKVTLIAEPVAVADEGVVLRELFRYRQLGLDPSGRAIGQFEATGERPTFLPRLEAAGIRLPDGDRFFAKRVLLRDG